jgi:hypothetical protein
MTAIAGSVFTASQFNTFIRDNLNECPAAKATTPGSHFATTATNQIAERIPASDYVATSEPTSSTAYTSLATIGPVVTVNTGTNALVGVYCNQNSSTGNAAWMGYMVSGASSIAVDESLAVQLQNTGGQRTGAVNFLTTLTPGTNTFTSQYRVSTSGTATFSVRRLFVIPF